MGLLQAKGPNNFQIFDLGQVSPGPDCTTLYQADGEEGGGRVPGTVVIIVIILTNIS